MKTLLKNGSVINVFTGEIERKNVLIEQDIIIGVGDYAETEADVCEDVSGKYICPGFIDSHIHIESTMLTPSELCKVALPHGTTSIVADPHEMANVCGVEGIEYMLESSEGLPLQVYVMLPSCVPATPFDESGAVLGAEQLLPLYGHPRVLGLAEMMNYPGVLAGDQGVLAKLADAKRLGKVIDGHAPMLSGKDLDRYTAAGIQSDHECSTAEEGKEKIRKGQWVMIRQGTAARNLETLLPLFDEPYCRRCVLVTDDRHPADLMKEGQIDHIIRLAIKAGKDPVTAIQMATIGAANCFRLPFVGAVAPGYRADLLLLDDLENVTIDAVYASGKKVVAAGEMMPFAVPSVSKELEEKVRHSFHLETLCAEDFYIDAAADKCRVIRLIERQLLTEEWITDICFAKNNGIDTERDILKLAVIERHKNTGHKGIGFISGVGMKKGAIASSVSHDSHNLIVIGTNDADMAVAANHILAMGGGSVVVAEGKVLADMPLPLAGLMTDAPAAEIAAQNEKLREILHTLGVPAEMEPFMSMAFVSLSVIPNLKMTTLGLVDVNNQKMISLYE